ncbi:hypothetical protein CBOM_02244 [Ceraceosorus bombacis]|uniref:F-box domain n=1 Tax=Ceraceosorus bombacis TaxID=401625 RepID=A0A0P1BE56_9BASI|nr:hypothetical protein CBOM_02244 [Ceraceosorus bombacis]
MQRLMGLFVYEPPLTLPSACTTSPDVKYRTSAVLVALNSLSPSPTFKTITLANANALGGGGVYRTSTNTLLITWPIPATRQLDPRSNFARVTPQRESKTSPSPNVLTFYDAPLNSQLDIFSNMKALRLMRRKSFGEDRAKREGHEAPPAMAPPMPTHQQRDFGTLRPPAHSNTMPDIRFSGFDFDNLIHDATKRATADTNFAPRTGAWNKSSTLPSSPHQGSRLKKYSPPPNLASQQAVQMHRSPRAEVERPRVTEAQLLAKQHSSKKRDSSIPGSTSPNVSCPPTMNAKSKDRRSSQGAVGPTKPDRASLIKPKSDSGRLSKRFERDAREQESSIRAEEARRLAAEQRKADKEKLEREQMQRELVHRLEMEQAQMDAAAVQERGRLAALAAREERLRKQTSASVLAAPPKSSARGPHPPSASGPRDATLRRSASATTTQDAAAPRPIAMRGATQTESDAPHAPSVSFQSPAGERQIRVGGVNGTATCPQDAKPKKMKRTTSRFDRAVAKGSRGQTAPLSPRSEGHVQEVVQLSMQETQARLAAGQPRKDRRTMSKPAKTFGVGWSCAGTADPALAVSHRRCVQYVVLRPRDSMDENGQRGSRGKGKGRYQTDAHTPPMSIAGSEGSSTSPLQQRAEEEEEEEEDDGLVETTEERWFSDLGEHIWTRTTPDVIARLVEHLDFADVKALHQTCSSIRQTLGQLAGREVTLRRFLAPLGYRTWQPTRRDQPPVDPLPLSLSDCEAFLLSYDVAPEYAAVAQQYISDRRALDPSIPRLALATVRAYNRSWCNVLLFPPSYFHNVLRSSSGSPVCYLDILPWRDALLSSMRLVQDHIETTTPHGRYRVAKWLYRAAVNVTGGQIISDEGLQVVDEGWHGRLVIETEGTSEHAKALIARCAGPTATPASRAALLACVINEAGRTNAKFEPPATRDAQGAKVETTSPWMILRERSRPGEIWLRPL